MLKNVNFMRRIVIHAIKTALKTYAENSGNTRT